MASRKDDTPPRAAAAMLPAPTYDPDGLFGSHPWWKAGDGACPDPAPQSAKLHAAKLWLGKFDQSGRLALKANGRPDYQTRWFRDRKQLGGTLGGLNRRLKEAGLREDDWFAYGRQAQPLMGESPLLSSYVPLIPGPASRQLYWQDYFAMSAKCFEAYWHSPIAHQGVDLTWEFVLGKGVKAQCATDRGQAAWDDFWERNGLDEDIHRYGRDISILGELFLEWFPTRAGLVVRSIDPATIYEVVTDQEDLKTVFFYHQQYPTRTELYAPPASNASPFGPTPSAVQKYVVRQIPADQVDHHRLNATCGEVRGRSDLFPVLGYLKRLDDYMTSKVVKADMEARFNYDVLVDGDDGQVRRVLQTLFPGGQPPPPGSPFVHNKVVELSAIEAAAATGEQDPTLELLIKLVAIGMGVPAAYLGIEGRGSRATALVATEPAAKRFEDRQHVTERILHRMAERVFDDAGLTGEDREIEFTFPSIVTEDRTQKLKDLAFAESMGWLAKETTAETAAGELGFTTFDQDAEQEKIAAEFDKAQDGKPDPADPDGEQPQGDGVIRRPMVSKDYAQTPKLDPTKPPTGPEDQPPGLLVPPTAAGDTPGSGQAGSPKSTAGLPADENPLATAGAANIRRDNRMQEGRVTLASSELHAIVEAAVRAGRAPRRRADDQDFERRSARYRDDTAANVDELAAGARSGGTAD